MSGSATPRVSVGEGCHARIAFEAVDKVYPDGTKAVSDLILDVHDGEFMVLVGPSGCGKTTALRMVAGLEDISDGTITIGERVINDVPAKDRDSPWSSRATP